MSFHGFLNNGFCWQSAVAMPAATSVFMALVVIVSALMVMMAAVMVFAMLVMAVACHVGVLHEVSVKKGLDDCIAVS